MLEILFQGFLEWIYTLVLAIWEYFSGAIIDIMSMDFAYLESHIPVLPVIQQTMLAAGWALLIGNLIFQSARSMLTGLGFEAEDPKLLFTRTFVFSFLLLASPQICEIGLNLTARIIALVELPSAVMITTLSESVFAGFATAWLLVIVCGLVVMYQSIKLFIEMAERYFILSMLTITSPLAFGMGGSKSTSGIFTGWCKMYGSMCLLMVLNVVFVKILMSVLAYSPMGVDVLPWMVLVMAIVRTAKKSDSIVTRIGLNPAITNEPRFPGMLSFIVARTMMSVVGNTIKQDGGASRAGTRRDGNPNGYRNGPNQNGNGGTGRNRNGGAGRNGPQTNPGGAPSSPSGGNVSGPGGSPPNSGGTGTDTAGNNRGEPGSGRRKGGGRKSGAGRGNGGNGNGARRNDNHHGNTHNQAVHQDSSSSTRQDVSSQNSSVQFTTQNTGAASGTGGQFRQNSASAGQEGQGTRRTSVPPGAHRAPAYTKPSSANTAKPATTGAAKEAAGSGATGAASTVETKETRYTNRPPKASPSPKTPGGAPATLSTSRSESVHSEVTESGSTSTRFSVTSPNTPENTPIPAPPMDVTSGKGSETSVKDSRFTHRTESHSTEPPKSGPTGAVSHVSDAAHPGMTGPSSPVIPPADKTAASEPGETRFTNRPAPTDHPVTQTPSGTQTHIPAAPTRADAPHSPVTAGAERQTETTRFTSAAGPTGTFQKELVTDSAKSAAHSTATPIPHPTPAPVSAASSPAVSPGRNPDAVSTETRFSQRDSSITAERSQKTITASAPKAETPRNPTAGSEAVSDTRQSARSTAASGTPERTSVIPPAGPRSAVPERSAHGGTVERESIPHTPETAKGASAPMRSGTAVTVSFTDTRQTTRETVRQSVGTGTAAAQERTSGLSATRESTVSAPKPSTPAAAGSTAPTRPERPAHPERTKNSGYPDTNPATSAQKMPAPVTSGSITPAKPERPARSERPENTRHRETISENAEVREHAMTQKTFAPGMGSGAPARPDRPGRNPVPSDRQPDRERTAGNDPRRGRRPEPGEQRPIAAQRERGPGQRQFAPNSSSGPARPNRSGAGNPPAYGQPAGERRQSGGRGPAPAQGTPHNRRPVGNPNGPERGNAVPPHSGLAGTPHPNPRQTAGRQGQNPNGRTAPYRDAERHPGPARRENSGYRPRNPQNGRPPQHPDAAGTMRGAGSRQNRRAEQMPPEQEKRPLFGLFGFGGGQSTRQSGRRPPNHHNDRR